MKISKIRMKKLFAFIWLISRQGHKEMRVIISEGAISFIWEYNVSPIYLPEKCAVIIHEKSVDSNPPKQMASMLIVAAKKSTNKPTIFFIISRYKCVLT